MDADQSLQAVARRAGVLHAGGEGREHPLQPPRPVRIGQEAVAERGAAGRRLLPAAHRGVAVDQVRKVELELVALLRGVRAGELALLALEAAREHLALLAAGQGAGVAVLDLVDDLEEILEGVAVLEAHPAPVADVEGAVELGAEALRIEVTRLSRVVTEVGPRQHRWRAPRPAGRVVGAGRRGGQPRSSRSDWKRPAWDFSALASVSNQSAISAKPSSRAVFAMPGYMSVYS